MSFVANLYNFVALPANNVVDPANFAATTFSNVASAASLKSTGVGNGAYPVAVGITF